MSDAIGSHIHSQTSLNPDPSTPYVIRTMTREDLDVAIAWAAAEGWNPGLHDADCFYHTDPNGFFMGFLEGEAFGLTEPLAIASLSAVKYGKTFGFIGFYIVRPEFRGYGYGFKLWQRGMDYLQGRTVGLDGVVAQQANYTKSRFQFAYRNIRYEGIGPLNQLNNGSEWDLPPGSELINLKKRNGDLGTAQLDQRLLHYDQAFFPDDRTEFLQRWMTQPDHYALGLIRKGALVGYGVVRPCQTGYKIGPLLADTAADAEVLFLSLRAHVAQIEARQTPDGQTGEPGTYRLYLDVPEPNASAVALAAKYEMKPMFETARMYTQQATQQAPNLPLDKIFGVTTFELG